MSAAFWPGAAPCDSGPASLVPFRRDGTEGVMPEWIWYAMAFVGLIGAYAVLGSHVGGLFGPDRKDKADTHAFSERGALIRRIVMMVVVLLGLWAAVDYVAS